MKAWFLSIAFLALVGCEALNLGGSEAICPAVVQSCPVPATPEIEYWLAELDTVWRFTPEQAEMALKLPQNEGNSPRLQFRRGLLNQQTATDTGWIRARDGWRKLLSEEMDAERRQLVELLLQYSQSMINAAARRNDLVAERDAAITERDALYGEIEELTAKIEALTHLEQNISERKNQSQDVEDGN